MLSKNTKSQLTLIQNFTITLKLQIHHFHTTHLGNKINKKSIKAIDL